MSFFYRRRRAARVIQRRPEPPPVVELPEGIGPDGYPTAYTRMSTLGLVSGQDLVLAPGTHYLYDISNFTVGHIENNGKLSFDPALSLTLVAKSISNTVTGKIVSHPSDDEHLRTNGLIIELNGEEESKVNAYMVDDISSTQPTALKRLWQATGAQAPTANETITITRNTATTFTVTGSVSGALGTGTVGTLFNNKIRFLADADIVNNRTIRVERRGSLNAGRSRALSNNGGKVILRGEPITAVARIQTTAASPTIAAGSNVITLDIDPVAAGWKIGQEIAVGTTEYYFWGINQTNDTAECEKFTITALNAGAKSVTLSGTLKRARWGMKQWVSETGVDENGRLTGEMSVTDTGYVPHIEGVPRELDQRAYVINLTRNVKIQGADDAAWAALSTGRFGAHIMTMQKDATFILENVEMKRVGQRGRHGRYGVHWHMCSYNMPDGMGFPSDGTFIGDVDSTKNYLKNCSTNFSAQHAVQIHGTCGVRIEDHVAWEIAGHTYNLEDGSEERNVFLRCGGMVSRALPNDVALQTKSHDGAAATFWWTNLNNDCSDGFSIMGWTGFWMSEARRCFGLSRDVDIQPIYTKPGYIKNMYCGSSMGANPVFNGSEITDERGAMGGMLGPTGGIGRGAINTFYFPTDNNKVTGNFIRPLLLEGFTITKSPSGYFNKVNTPHYRGVIAADNVATAFNGAVDAGLLEKSLLIGISKNHTPYVGSTTTKFQWQTGTASYHNTQVNQKCLFVNFGQGHYSPDGEPLEGSSKDPFAWDSKNGWPGQENTGRHATGSSDYYQNSIELGQMFHSDNKFLSSDPGVRSRPWNLRQMFSGEADYSSMNSMLSLADLDANGYYGPAGWYRIANIPYCTTYLSTSQAIPNHRGYWVTTPDKIYGLMPRMFPDTAELERCELRCALLDSSYNEVALFTLERNTTGSNGDQFRYTTVRKDLRFKITTGVYTPAVGRMHWTFYNANAADDRCVVGLPCAAKPSAVRMYGGALYNLNLPSNDGVSGRTYTEVASLAALDASSGDTWFWASGILWAKYRGGYTLRNGVIGKDGEPAQSPTDYRLYEQPLYPNTLIILP